MAQYLQNIRELSKNFKELEVLQILRLENARADALSYLTTSDFPELNQKVLIKQLDKPSIKVLSIFQVGYEPSWINPLMDYISRGILPNDLVKVRSIKGQASWYVLQGSQLYKMSYFFPLLQCLAPSEADYALQKIYERI